MLLPCYSCLGDDSHHDTEPMVILTASINGNILDTESGKYLNWTLLQIVEDTAAPTPTLPPHSTLV